MSARSIQHYDVVIAGARCAGAATALLLARQGARVLVLDKSRYGTDTLSTHALMRGAVVQLHRWGVLPRVVEAGTPPVRSTTFHLRDAVTTIKIKPKHGVDALYAPRRTVLDTILADAARSAGADVRFGTSVTGLRRDRAGRVTGITGRAGATRLEVSADLVVGADGRRSTVARDVSAGTAHVAPASSAVIYRYFREDQAAGYHWYFRDQAAAGVIPTNDGAGLRVRRHQRGTPAPRTQRRRRRGLAAHPGPGRARTGGMVRSPRCGWSPAGIPRADRIPAGRGRSRLGPGG